MTAKSFWLIPQYFVKTRRFNPQNFSSCGPIGAADNTDCEGSRENKGFADQEGLI